MCQTGSSLHASNTRARKTADQCVMLGCAWTWLSGLSYLIWPLQHPAEAQRDVLFSRVVHVSRAIRSRLLQVPLVSVQPHALPAGGVELMHIHLQSDVNHRSFAGWVPHHLCHPAPWNPPWGEMVDSPTLAPPSRVLTVCCSSGGRLCHPAQGWVWLVERRSHAAVHGVVRGLRRVLCSVCSLPGGRRWDGLVAPPASPSSPNSWS